MSHTQQPSVAPQATQSRDYRVMSIIALILCWPLGLVALLKSVRARREYAAAIPTAQRSASAAKNWSIASFITAGIVMILSTVFVIVGINALAEAKSLPEVGPPPAAVSKTDFCPQLVDVLDPLTTVGADEKSTVGDVDKAIDTMTAAAAPVNAPADISDDWNTVIDGFGKIGEKLKTAPADANFMDYVSDRPELQGSETMQDAADEISDYCTY